MYLNLLVNVPKAPGKLTRTKKSGTTYIDVRTLINIENYKGNPKFEVLYPLVRAMNIDPWYTSFYCISHALRSV